MKEIFDSFYQHFLKRAKSQIYGVFGLWWTVFHWAFFYALVFLDQDLIFKHTGLLKDTYLKKTYFDYSSVIFWFDFFAPFAMTYVTIWVLPWFILKAYKKEKHDDYDRQEVRNDYEKKIEDLKVKLENKRAQKADATTKRVRKEKSVEKIESREWDDDYTQFKKSKVFSEFQAIVESIYEHQGQIKTWDGDIQMYTFEIPGNVLVYAHTNDLIELHKEVDKIDLTEKGKFFIRRYSLE